MWPWTHVAVAYILASGTLRWRTGRGPSDAAAVAVVAAAFAPDVVDKSLSWLVPVLPGGRSLAHSALVAVPFAALAVGLARRRDAAPVGLAVAVGYLSHLPLDVVGSGLTDGTFATGFLLWPLTPTETARPDAALPHLLGLVDRAADFAGTARGVAYLTATVAVLGLSLAVWLRDGRPGLGLLGSRGESPDG